MLRKLWRLLTGDIDIGRPSYGTLPAHWTPHQGREYEGWIQKMGRRLKGRAEGEWR